MDSQQETKKISKLEVQFEESLDTLQESNPHGLIDILQNGVTSLISETFKYIECCQLQQSVFSLLDKVTDVLMFVSESGQEAKVYLASTSLQPCIDFILTKHVWFIHKLEVLKALNIALEGVPVVTKKDFLKSQQLCQSIRQLYVLIFSSGDYEFQVCLIECLFRILPRSIRIKLIEDVQIHDVYLDDFLGIKDSDFEADCRIFLNKVNGQDFIHQQRVHSLVADYVTLDGEKVFKPADYADFWVDFNFGSKRISLFCEPTLLSTQVSQGDQLWETLHIWKADISRYDISENKSLTKLTVELAPGAQLLSNKVLDEQPHLMVIAVQTGADLTNLMKMMMGKKKDRVSTVLEPIIIERKQEEASQQSIPGRRKVSVPSQLMMSPASCSLSSGSEKMSNAYKNNVDMTIESRDTEQSFLSNTDVFNQHEIEIVEATQPKKKERQKKKSQDVDNDSDLKGLSISTDGQREILNQAMTEVPKENEVIETSQSKKRDRRQTKSSNVNNDTQMTGLSQRKQKEQLYQMIAEFPKEKEIIEATQPKKREKRQTKSLKTNNNEESPDRKIEPKEKQISRQYMSKKLMGNEVLENRKTTEKKIRHENNTSFGKICETELIKSTQRKKKSEMSKQDKAVHPNHTEKKTLSKLNKRKTKSKQEESFDNLSSDQHKETQMVETAHNQKTFEGIDSSSIASSDFLDISVGGLKNKKIQKSVQNEKMCTSDGKKEIELDETNKKIKRKKANSTPKYKEQGKLSLNDRERSSPIEVSSSESSKSKGNTYRTIEIDTVMHSKDESSTTLLMNKSSNVNTSDHGPLDITENNDKSKTSAKSSDLRKNVNDEEKDANSDIIEPITQIQGGGDNYMSLRRSRRGKSSQDSTVKSVSILEKDGGWDTQTRNKTLILSSSKTKMASDVASAKSRKKIPHNKQEEQPAKPPEIKTVKKVKTPVVAIKPIICKEKQTKVQINGCQDNKHQDIQADCVPSSCIEFDVLDRTSTALRTSSRAKKPDTDHMIQEPTVTSNYEENLADLRNTLLGGMSPAGDAACSSMLSGRSPFTQSCEEFKPTKSFKSLNGKKVKGNQMKSETCKSQQKLKKAESKSISPVEEKKVCQDTLGELIPSLSELNEKFDNVSSKKNKNERHISTDKINERAISITDKRPEHLGTVDLEVLGESVSISNSGDLYIETDDSINNEKHNDTIAETQDVHKCTDKVETNCSHEELKEFRGSKGCEKNLKNLGKAATNETAREKIETKQIKSSEDYKNSSANAKAALLPTGKYVTSNNQSADVSPCKSPSPPMCNNTVYSDIIETDVGDLPGGNDIKGLPQSISYKLQFFSQHKNKQNHHLAEQDSEVSSSNSPENVVKNTHVGGNASDLVSEHDNHLANTNKKKKLAFQSVKDKVKGKSQRVNENKAQNENLTVDRDGQKGIKLRPRNKTVSYNECSFEASSSDHNSFFTQPSHNATQKKQKLPQIKSKSEQTVRAFGNESSLKNMKRDFSLDTKSVSRSIFEEPLKPEGDKGCSFSQTPKRLLKHTGHRTHSVWKKHTVTTYSTLTHSTCSKDPYSFETECQVASQTSSYRDFAAQENRNKVSPTCVNFNEDDKENLKDTKFRHRNKVDKDQVRQRETYSGKSHHVTAIKKSKSGAASNKNLKDMSKSYTSETPSYVTDGCEKTPQHGLFSSQRNLLKSNSGLIFPPLEDSIPCTPYEDQINEDIEDPDYAINDTSERKSVGSQLSWLARTKTPELKVKQMRGKTYQKHIAENIKSRQETTQNRNDDLSDDEAPKDFQYCSKKVTPSLQYKKKKSNNTSKEPAFSTKSQSSARLELLSPLDLKQTERDSPDSIDDYQDSPSIKSYDACLPRKRKDNCPTSILTGSSKKLDKNYPTKQEKSISFKSPSSTETSPLREKSNSSENEDGIISELEDIDDSFAILNKAKVKQVSHMNTLHKARKESGSASKTSRGCSQSRKRSLLKEQDFDLENSPKLSNSDDLSDNVLKEPQLLLSPPMKILDGRKKKQSRKTNSFASSDFTWSSMSSALNNQLCDVVERICGTSPNNLSGSGFKSGPSSTVRPTRSALKRKFPDVSDSGSDRTSSDHSYKSHSTNSTSARKCLKFATSPTHSIELAQMTDVQDDVQPFVPTSVKTPSEQQAVPEKAKALGRPKKCVRTNAAEKTKRNEKRKSQRRLDLSPPSPVNSKKTGNHLLFSQFDVGLSPSFEVNSSPEKCREHKSAKDEEEESSAGEPLTLSSLLSAELLSPQTTCTHSSSDNIDYSEPITVFSRIVNEVKKCKTLNVREKSSETSSSRFSEYEDEDMNDDFNLAPGLASLRNLIVSKSMKMASQSDQDLHVDITSPIKLQETGKRNTAIGRFQETVEHLIYRHNKEIKEMKEFEDQMSLLWHQNLQRLEKNRISQTKELNKMRQMHEESLSDLKQNKMEEEKKQKSLKAVVKKDMQNFQKKLVLQFNSQSLEAMRRCLQTSLMFS